MSSGKSLERSKIKAKPAGKAAAVSALKGPSTGAFVPKGKPATRGGVEAKTLTFLSNKLSTMQKVLDEQGKLIQFLLRDRDAPTARPAAPVRAVAPTRTPAPEVSSAAAALEALRGRLAVDVRPEGVGLTVAEASEATKHQWIDSGLLVGWRDLAEAWGGRSRQALDQACDRGELFNLKIAGKRWYPSMFLGLSAESVKAICLALKGVDPVSKVIFWARPHGALGGRTLAQAVEAGQLERVAQLAQDFADEYTGHAALT